MKRFMIMALMLIGIGVSASAQNFGFGVNLSYGSEIEKPSFGIKALYDINETFAIAPSFNYYLPESDDYLGVEYKFWDINVDLHWNCYDADMYQLYPLIGVTYLNGKVSAEDSGLEVSASDGEFGVNLGFGGQLYLTENWLVSAEVKYQIIDQTNQFVPSLSLIYKF